MKKSEYISQAEKALEYFSKANIVLTEDEKSRIEVADFGLGRVNEIGLQLLTYINTERVCAKEMVLLPGQACPEHRHIPTNGMEGKEETFRCLYGRVHLFIEGGKREGISKVNIFTDLCIAGADAMRDAALSHEDYLKTREMRVSRINAAVKQKIRLFGSDGKY